MAKISEKMKKTIKKAQFFSITIFLIIVLAIIIFALVARLKDNEERFNINRLKKSVMNNFVTDFEQLYVEQIIKASLKPAVSEFLKKDEVPTTFDNLVKVMNGETVNGVVSLSNSNNENLAMENTLKKSMGTVTFSIDNINDDDLFNVVLEKVEQKELYELEFTFKVNYKFKIDVSTWEKDDLEVKIKMDIYSLEHPVFKHPSNPFIQEGQWAQNNEADECFAQQVFYSATCNEILNIKPII